MARFFNHIMQCDGYTLLGFDFMMIIDECFRYKQSDLLVNKTATFLKKLFLTMWIRYFGPPHYMVVDADGTLASSEIAVMCDAWDIKRVLSGSDPQRAGMQSKHTTTGLAEKHIHLLKDTTLKAHADCAEAGIEVEIVDLVQESCVAHNSLLTFNGVAPNLGVLGYQPRDLYEIENASLDAYPRPTGARDVAEIASTIRLHCKSATMKTIAETRLAQSVSTKPQQIQLTGDQHGQLVDLFRAPNPRDVPGWRGPAVLLDLNRADNSAIVKWQGRPYTIPLRHLREHRGFFALMLALHMCRRGPSRDGRPHPDQGDFR